MAFKNLQKKSNFKTIFICFLLGWSVSGCSNYSNTFDCPHGQGVGCASISKVDKMIDAHMVRTDDDLSGVNPQSGKKPVSVYFGPSRPLKPLAIEGLPVI